MNKSYCLLLIPLFIVFNKPVLSQDTTEVTIDSSAVYYYHFSLDSLALENLHHIDTLLDNVQQYNPTFRPGHYFASLGNPGLAHDNLVFNPVTEVGFDYGLHSFDYFMYNNSNTRYYQLFRPYTDVFYTMGAKKEQFVRVIHSQNPIRNFNFGVDFRFIHSPGFYNRQLSDDKSLSLNGQYSTRNKRYGINVNYIHDKVIVQENGGLLTDSIFTKNLESDRLLYKVRLNNAENLVKKAGIYFNQYFNLSKPPQAVHDTLQDSLRHKKFHLGRISHSFSWERRQLLFTDNDTISGFYSPFHPWQDSVLIHDTSFVLKFENELSWSNLSYSDKPDDKPIYMKFGIRQQHIKVGDDSTKTTYNQIIPFGQLSFYILKSFRLNASYDFVIGDYNGGDFSFRANVNQYLGNQYKNLGMLSIKARYAHVTPPWFYNHYHGDVFRWDNSFAKTEYLTGEFDYTYKRLKAGIKYNLIKNYTYLDTLARPAQFGENFSVLQAFLIKNFRLGKFGIDNNIVFQTTSKSDILHMPEIIAHVNFNFTQSLFSDATIIQPGLEFFYNTAYYSNAYMPDLRSFYLQNSIKTGNYVYADVYLNIKIKRVRMFMKYQHFNAGFMGYEYFMVPHYPMKDGAFKFGVSWKFYD